MIIERFNGVWSSLHFSYAKMILIESYIACFNGVWTLNENDFIIEQKQSKTLYHHKQKFPTISRKSFNGLHSEDGRRNELTLVLARFKFLEKQSLASFIQLLGLLFSDKLGSLKNIVLWNQTLSNACAQKTLQIRITDPKLLLLLLLFATFRLCFC